MATTAKTKKTTATVKKGTKKSETVKQIENLEKALENVRTEDVVNLVPEEVKADIEAAEKFETPEEIDFDGEIRKIIETAEPSEEVKEQVSEFEAGKEKFNEKITKEPEKAAEIVQEEIKRVEAVKKNVEALKDIIQKSKKGTLGNEGFTNWWNGSSGLY